VSDRTLKRVFIPPRRRSTQAIVAIALAAAVAALLLAAAINAVVGTFPFTLLVLAVVLSAWFGHRFGGVMTTAALTVLTPLALPPVFSWRLTATEDGVRLAVEVAVALVVGAIVGGNYGAADALHTVVNSASDGVLVTDAAGRLVYMNRAAAALTGWTLPEARGRSVAEVARVTDLVSGEPVSHPVRQGLERRQAVQVPQDATMLSRDRQRHHIAGTVSPVLSDRARLLGAVFVFRNQRDAVLEPTAAR
jgi:PAS domain S-box-containing protein